MAAEQRDEQPLTERRIAAIMARIRDGFADRDGWPLALGARGTCTVAEVAEAHRRIGWTTGGAHRAVDR